jgi:hypothetical protein
MTSTIRIHNGPDMHWGVGVLFAAGASARQPVLLVS